MFEIIVGSDFFFGSSEDTFTCTLYCQTQDGAFPDCEWTDFAQTVLSWWSDAVAGAAHARNMKFQLLFEDGPFWIDAEKQDDEVTLHFNTDKRATQTIPAIRIPFRTLAQTVEKALRTLSSSLYLHHNPDLSQQLADQAATLRKRIP